MKGRSSYVALIACLILACSAGYAAQTVKGTVVSSLGASVVVSPDGGGQNLILKPQAGASLMRGQVGMVLRKATLSDFAPGDRIVAVVSQNGELMSAKTFYAVSKGTLSMKSSGRLFFKDGRFVKLAPGARVVLSTGKIGTVDDLKVGASIICRVNPSTENAWMVVATNPLPAKPAPAKTNTAPAKVKGITEVATAPVYPGSKPGIASVTIREANPATVAAPDVHPVIDSVTYVAPEGLKARDWMRVEMTGTPGGRAVCEVKGLIPRTVMKETEPGKYRASVMVPGGKFVRNQPVLGHLTVSGVDAPTVQASRLITVEAPPAEPVTVPEPVVAVAPAEVPAPEPAPEVAPAPETAPTPEPEPAPAVEPEKPEPPAPEPPKVKAPVVVTAPAMGARILRSLLVTGTAEPGSSVMVGVTYTNGLGGLLNLSGQISSQLVAVDPNGRFQMGPIPLEGPLATKGLLFTVRACYPEAEQAAVVVSAFGDRS